MSQCREILMSTCLFPTAVLMALVSFGASAGERPWPRFRGPNGEGISDAATVPATWTEKDYNWRVKVPGAGHSSPAVWGRRIFLTSGDRTTAGRMVLCLDTANGHTLWQRDFPSKPFNQNNDNSYMSASPAADADGVAVTWSTPQEVALLALDNEGRDLWRRNLGPYVGGHGTAVSPIIVDGLVVLGNDQEDPKSVPSMYGPNPTIPPGKSFLIAVDRKTGETRWQTERRTWMSPYSTPCVSPSVEGRPELIFASTAHGITGVDVATGKVNWEMGGLFTDRCVGSPVLAPGLVIAGFGNGAQGTRWVAVRPGSREKGIEPTLAYEVKRPVPLVPTPLVKDGRLFLWGDDGIVACLKAATGETIWRERLGASFYGSPVCVGNRLYCMAKTGEVFVLAASDKFEVLGRVSLGEASFATPAVADGVMYLRTRSQLFSLGGPPK